MCNHQSSGKGKSREIISQNASDVYSTCVSVFPWIMHSQANDQGASIDYQNPCLISINPIYMDPDYNSPLIY